MTKKNEAELLKTLSKIYVKNPSNPAADDTYWRLAVEQERR